MNTTDIDNMPAGPELDALVAEKVMGWRLINLRSRRKYEYAKSKEDRDAAASEENYEWYWEGHGAPAEGYSHEFKPSSDIAAAWQIVAKMRALGLDVDIETRRWQDRKQWLVTFVDWDEVLRIEQEDSYVGLPSHDDSVEVAICREALKAVRSAAPVPPDAVTPGAGGGQT